jgi:hypothetical protein
VPTLQHRYGYEHTVYFCLPVRLACGDEIPTWSRRYIHSRFLCLSATFSRWRAEKSRHQLSSSESQCSHRGPQNQPRDKCHAGRGEATIPTNCRLIQPDRGATHTSLEPSSGRPLRQRQTASKHGVPQHPSGLSQHDVVSITQGQRRRSDGNVVPSVQYRCRRGMAFCRSPMQKHLGAGLLAENLKGWRAKPAAGLSLSGARPQGT